MSKTADQDLALSDVHCILYVITHKCTAIHLKLFRFYIFILKLRGTTIYLRIPPACFCDHGLGSRKNSQPDAELQGFKVKFHCWHIPECMLGVLYTKPQSHIIILPRSLERINKRKG